MCCWPSSLFEPGLRNRQVRKGFADITSTAQGKDCFGHRGASRVVGNFQPFTIFPLWEMWREVFSGVWNLRTVDGSTWEKQRNVEKQQSKVSIANCRYTLSTWKQNLVTADVYKKPCGYRWPLFHVRTKMKEKFEVRRQEIASHELRVRAKVQTSLCVVLMSFQVYSYLVLLVPPQVVPNVLWMEISSHNT